MSIRPSQDPYSGIDPYVDKLIGNAYEVVKYVARYVKTIRYVAFNMEHIHRVSNALFETIVIKKAILSLGTTIEINLPVGLSAGMIINTTVTAQTIDGEVYPASPSTFSWKISNGKLVVEVSPMAPVALVNAELRWLLNWQSPVQIQNEVL